MNEALLVLDTIKNYNMLSPNSSVLVCVSGGADSMCLLSMLNSLSETLGIRVYAAHFNHLLRGEESDGDEAFVKGYCDTNSIPLFIGSGDVRSEAKSQGKGIEETARTMRYNFFFETAKNNSIDKIATAHNADDNLETLLLRMCRGTGLLGMCGIPPVRENIIRPLLCLSRSQIESYLREKNISHREDSSNASDSYSRNRLRHHVTPIMREINPGVSSLAFNMSEQFRCDNNFLEELAKKFVKDNYHNGAIGVNAVLSAPYPIASRALRQICGTGLSYEHINSIIDLCNNCSASVKLSLPGITITKQYDMIIFHELESKTFSPVYINMDGDTVIHEIGAKFTCKKTILNGTIHKSFTSFLFKSDAVCGRIIARPRVSGDSIVLSEGSGTKSLKKLFIEKKIPAYMRGSIPVIADDYGPIAIPGIGCSIRVRPHDGDKVFEVTYKEITD